MISLFWTISLLLPKRIHLLHPECELFANHVINYNILLRPDNCQDESAGKFMPFKGRTVYFFGCGVCPLTQRQSALFLGGRSVPCLRQGASFGAGVLPHLRRDTLFEGKECTI